MDGGEGRIKRRQEERGESCHLLWRHSSQDSLWQEARGIDFTLSALSTMSLGSWVSALTISRLRMGTVGGKSSSSSCSAELARSGCRGSTRIFTTLPLLVPMNRTSKALPARSLAPWCTAIFVKSSLEPDFTNTGVEGREGTALSMRQWFLMKWRPDSGREVESLWHLPGRGFGTWLGDMGSQLLVCDSWFLN